MDAILTDSHLDTRIKIFILMNAMVPKLELCRRSIGREIEAGTTVMLEPVQITAAKTKSKKLMYD